MSDKVTLIIFTCEGKEHLLPATLDSFKSKCNYKFHSLLLALDGTVNQEVIKYVNPNIIVQNHTRKGYIHSILNALSLVKTEYFFWLEDDWEFLRTIEIEKQILQLKNEPFWTEIIFTQDTELKKKENYISTENGYYFLQGFSANPCLCRTDLLKEAFNELLLLPKDESTKLVGFENFLHQYFENKNLKCAVLDPENNAFTNHSGQLESTAREYHMINSVDTSVSDVGKEYISGLGYNRSINLKNKIKMIFKLSGAFIKLALKQFKSRKAYDYAFRVTQASSNNFKH